MATTKHGLQETKGVFQIRGKVTGADKGNFFTEKKTQKGKDFRMVNFGIEIDNGKAIYLGLNGMPKDEVYFSKKLDDGKIDMKKVQWANRATFKEEGYGLLGTKLGLEKGEDGKNIQVSLVEYDACKKISDSLSDDQSVFAKGKIEFGSYTKDGSTKRTMKFIPEQMSLCTKEVEFEAEDFEMKSDFKQQLVFMGIEKKDGQFILSAKIVTYSTIEDAEFIVKDEKLAGQLKKNLKPYNAITVHGNIVVQESVNEAEEDDCWGEADPTKFVSAPTKRDLVITGATPSTIDKETYTKEAMEEAEEKLNQSAVAKDEWGTNSTVATDDEW